MTTEDVCRICGNTKRVKMFRFSDTICDNNRTTAQVIEDCFGLSVRNASIIHFLSIVLNNFTSQISEDELSSLYCIQCKNDLKVALKLITSIRESDLKLKSILTIPKVEVL